MTSIEARSAVAAWNTRFPPGTPVRYYHVHHRPDFVKSQTAGIAFLRGRLPVVEIDGVKGAVALFRLVPPGGLPPPVDAPRFCRRHRSMTARLGVVELMLWATRRRRGPQRQCRRCKGWFFREEF